VARIRFPRRYWLVAVGLAAALLVCGRFARQIETALSSLKSATVNQQGDGQARAIEASGLAVADRAVSLDGTGSLDRFPPAGPISFPQVVDVDGVLRHPGQSDAGVTTVFVFLATHCPICNAYLPELNRIYQAFAPRNVEFYGVIADRRAIGDGRAMAAEAANHRRMYQVVFPLLLDTSGTFRRQLRPTHTPQVIVVDRHGAIVYSGRIDDRYEGISRPRLQVTRRDLSDVLRAVSSGRDLSFSRTEPVGCLIESADAEVTSQQLTFCRDIAPIVFANCLRCHREGESAPFALATYEDVRDRAAQIASVVEQRIMPPWRARQGFGRFLNERCLNADEIERLTSWVRNGAPRGDSADLPPRPQFTAGWQLGQPDFVITMPDEFEVPADGPDIYRNFVIPTGLSTDRLVSAFEFRPGNPRIVHHSWVFLDTRGEGRRLDAADPGPGYTNFGGPGFVAAGDLGGWSPGGLPRRLPAGLGRPIPANSDLVLQIHYHPTGKRERDRSTIGFYFAPPTAQCQAGEIMVANYDLDIRAGARNQLVRGSHTLPVNTYLLDVTPHMHQLGRKMEVTAVLPDHTVVPLVAIDDWSFSWQDHYIFREPVCLPAGTEIKLEAWYDNSSDNPQNPHRPPRDVNFGEKSDDEMCMCYFQVATGSFGELQLLENDKYAYIGALMQQYRQGMARRAAMAARLVHPSAPASN
jgi:thiol-disulfide isomerase/thioredoxin